MQTFQWIVCVICLISCSHVFSFQSSLFSNRFKLKTTTQLRSTAVLGDPSFVDFRVGKVLEIEPHPNMGDVIYVTKVDIGEKSGPRTICSGIAEFVPASKLKDQLVVTCCNLKPRNIDGVMSTGMILISKDDNFVKYDFLHPPEGSIIGEQVQIEGYISEPLEIGNRIVKVMMRINKDFVVDENGIACYQKSKWSTSAGFIKSDVPGRIS